MRPWLAAVPLALAACTPRTPPAPPPAAHYVVGAPYQLGGVWSYPQENFQYEATGLAERVVATGLATDGERLDPAAMTGAHRTLQLPAIVDVTNLANGHQIRIHLNDRGPAAPGRVLGLSARAADLLGAGSAPIPVRIELDSAASQALRDHLGGGPAGITAAPVASVQQETLAAPGQGRAAQPLARVAAAAAPDPTPPALETLPATVRVVPVPPSQLWINAGQFTQSGYASALSGRLSSISARVERRQSGRAASYVVVAGPFASPREADAALDQARAAGVTDASIVVE